ncbi:hypothetical protein [Symbioplanes lichenis]|uniref:hypothetical protein n=1 Tax=Symbioplanes lichenis TaxID=1629072 RepID=UPI00273992D4|nr:hypothetical protein [Actinoplanes lichenis]
MRRLAAFVTVVTCGLSLASCSGDDAAAPKGSTPATADGSPGAGPGGIQGEEPGETTGEGPGGTLDPGVLGPDNIVVPGGDSTGVPVPGVSGIPAVDDPPGAIACAMAGTAARAGSFMTPGVVVAIQHASSTADAPVADAAGRLTIAYNAAVRAQGANDEPDKVAAVSAAAAELTSVCGDSGLETAG